MKLHTLGFLLPRRVTTGTASLCSRAPPKGLAALTQFQIDLDSLRRAAASQGVANPGQPQILISRPVGRGK